MNFKEVSLRIHMLAPCCDISYAQVHASWTSNKMVNKDELKEKVVRILINVLNFKNKEGFNKLMEQIRPIIMFL